MKELAVILDPNSLQPKQLQPDYVSSYLFLPALHYFRSLFIHAIVNKKSGERIAPRFCAELNNVLRPGMPHPEF